jgi:hypothetical protein
VLALLSLNANRVLTRERLIDELWGENAPEAAVKTVQGYVWRLRKLLPEGMLVTRPPSLSTRSGVRHRRRHAEVRASVLRPDRLPRPTRPPPRLVVASLLPPGRRSLIRRLRKEILAHAIVREYPLSGSGVLPELAVWLSGVDGHE